MHKIFDNDSFRVIPKDYLNILLTKCTILNFPKGKLLHEIGDSISSVLVILSGQFISFRLTVEGKKCTVKIMNTGEIIGEENLFTCEKIDTFVESTMDSQCLSIPKNEYEKLINHFPQFSRVRLEKVYKRLKETEHTMQAIAYNTVKQRLLLILTNIGKEIGINKPDEIEFVLNWSHEELASMIGSTRESITNTFSILQLEEVLKINNKTLYINKEKLQNYLLLNL